MKYNICFEQEVRYCSRQEVRLSLFFNKWCRIIEVWERADVVKAKEVSFQQELNILSWCIKNDVKLCISFVPIQTLACTHLAAFTCTRYWRCMSNRMCLVHGWKGFVMKHKTESVISAGSSFILAKCLYYVGNGKLLGDSLGVSDVFGICG